MDEKLIFHSGSTIEEGKAAALQLIDESPGATAILAANDLVAIGAATTLLDQGMKIPEEISVIGFGNTLTAEHFRVPLTTVSQPKYRRGISAMESMSALLAGESVGTKRLASRFSHPQKHNRAPEALTSGPGQHYRAAKRSTYLPSISASRFTASPTARSDNAVDSNVCGIIQIVKLPFSTAATVRLMPSTADGAFVDHITHHIFGRGDLELMVVAEFFPM